MVTLFPTTAEKPMGSRGNSFGKGAVARYYADVKGRIGEIQVVVFTINGYLLVLSIETGCARFTVIVVLVFPASGY